MSDEKYKQEARSSWQEIASIAESVPESASYIHGFIDGISRGNKELEECKNLLKQAVLLVETDKSDYSLKNVWVYNKHEWLKKAEEVLK